MNQQYTERASGLIVPSATLDKTLRTVLVDDFRKVERFMAWAGRMFPAMVVFHCSRCHGRIHLKRVNRIEEEIVVPGGAVDAPGGQITLFCDCTNWTVR